MIDWDQGEYEHTAKELWPAAERAVKDAGVSEDERVLDLGCGTGNVALLAARTGAEVTAVDPAPRLLSVARGRLAAEDLDADFVQASAGELPFPDESFDAVLSVFAVIFADDPTRAAAEIVRILDAEGRAVITTWPPSGPVFEMIGVLTAAAAALNPDEPPPTRFPWGDADAVRELFNQAGAAVEVSDGEIAIEAPSADAYLTHFESVHPAGLVVSQALKNAGVYDEPRARAVEVLRARTEVADGIRIVNPYLQFQITK